MSTTSDYTTVIQHKVTGELITVEEYLDMYMAEHTPEKESRWNKVYIQHFVEMLNSLPGAAPKILGYLLQHRGNNNLITATNKTIAEHLEISVNSVNTLMAKLVKADMLRRAERGMYMLNPHVATHGKFYVMNKQTWQTLKGSK
jgi:DNA-binding MarR family transcriptional regulator